MNKLATVLGVAAVATLAGCKNPNYKPMSAMSQDDVKVVEPVSCTCPPGTIHEVPCACGASDCFCVTATKPVEVKPVEVKPIEVKPIVDKPVEVKPITPPPAIEEEVTVYTVRNGDYLAKISKRYNVTISSIKRLNNLTSDTIRVGQKLKLPGKIDLGAVPAVEAKPAVKAAAKSTAKPDEAYKGETREYVVKGGDTLGAIAYSNGCNIRQLKQLNNLTGDALRVGQKLKVPAKVTKIESSTVAKPAVEQGGAEVGVKADKKEVPVVASKSEPEGDDKPVAEGEGQKKEEATNPAAEPEGATYVVQEGEDITAICIKFSITHAALCEINHLPENAQLQPGQVIRLPAEAQQ